MRDIEIGLRGCQNKKPASFLDKTEVYQIKLLTSRENPFAGCLKPPDVKIGLWVVKILWIVVKLVVCHVKPGTVRIISQWIVKLGVDTPAMVNLYANTIRLQCNNLEAEGAKTERIWEKSCGAV